MRGGRIVHDHERSVKHEPSSSEKKGTATMIRVVPFADLVNKYDFAELILLGERLRRTPLGYLLAPPALLARAIKSLAVSARDALEDRPRLPIGADPTLVNWDGSFR
jgi:hypothetical protein